MFDLYFSDYSTITELNNASGRRVLILRRKDGKYCFAEQLFWQAASEDEGMLIGWAGESMSGLYPTADDAESAAWCSTP